MFFPIIMQYGSGALCEEKGKKGAVVFQNQGGISVSFFIKFRDLFQKQAFCKCWNCQVTPCPVLTGTQNVIVCPKEHVSWVKTEMLGGGISPPPFFAYKIRDQVFNDLNFLIFYFVPFSYDLGPTQRGLLQLLDEDKRGEHPLQPQLYVSFYARASFTICARTRGRTVSTHIADFLRWSLMFLRTHYCTLALYASTNLSLDIVCHALTDPFCFHKLNLTKGYCLNLRYT